MMNASLVPRIEVLPQTQLVGLRMQMTFAQNRTRELWQSFMPRRKELTTVVGSDLYSVEVYPNTAFFESFDPTRTFEKWAAVQVSVLDGIPEDMEHLELSEGPYAVFLYKGKPSEAPATYQYIYNSWLPNSPYILDDRPHFAIMGEQYKGEHPDSEEELWVPVVESESLTA